MNLVIDIGNSGTKLWLFDQSKEEFSLTVDNLMKSDIDKLLQQFSGINKAILCSVKDYPSEIKQYLQEKIKIFIELDEYTPLPIENLYRTPSTLGKDRLAGATGAASLYPGENILIIDAGTAITYDLVNNQNQYAGGNISPGLEMRYKALNHFTRKLPLLKFQEFNGIFGQTTPEAIHTGVQLGLLLEVENVINTFKENYKNLIVIITGGNTNFFVKKLKNSFFVNYNLIAIGLNRILEHNGEI